jgi:hypothetical protein
MRSDAGVIKKRTIGPAMRFACTFCKMLSIGQSHAQNRHMSALVIEVTLTQKMMGLIRRVMKMKVRDFNCDEVPT